MTKMIFKLVLITTIFFISSCSYNEDFDIAIPSVKQERKKDTVNSSISINNAQVTKPVLSEMKLEDYAQLTDKKSIEAVFGESQMQEGISYYDEGTTQYTHTLVTNPATTHQIKYVWDSEGKLIFIEANYKRQTENEPQSGIQMTQSDCGIYLGMKLEELATWNGKAISFYGFGWDREGVIKKEEKSKMAGCRVVAKLGIDLDETTPSSVMGDVLLSSADKKVKSANIFVSQFIYYPIL